MTDSAVWVFGGGGVVGIAWEIGILTGLADEGANVSPDSVLIGTSAGSVVAAQLASGLPIEALYERQTEGVPYETVGSIGFGAIVQLATAPLFARDAEDAGRRIGRRALAAGIPNADQRRRNIEARLPSHEWGDRDVRIVAVDAESGAMRVFTRADGVGLVDAVGASCAVPFSVAPVVIEGRPYIDGGMRSTVNLDLAPGTGPVIALAPSAAAVGRWASLRHQRAVLGDDRVVEIVTKDATTRKIAGSNVMNRAVVPALVAAAREQGRREASRISAVLSTP